MTVKTLTKKELLDLLEKCEDIDAFNVCLKENCNKFYAKQLGDYFLYGPDYDEEVGSDNHRVPVGFLK